MERNSEAGGEDRGQQRRAFTPTSHQNTTKRPRTTTDNPSRTDGNSTSFGTGVFMLNTDILDCPICYESLSSPMYQCKNGHVACESCCMKINKKCPSCASQIGDIRCRVMENVLETLQILCENFQYGCVDKIGYILKDEHHCRYVPSFCAYPSCDYMGTCESFYTHFSTKHKNSLKPFTFNWTIFLCLSTNEKQVFLHESGGNTLFMLNRSVEPYGSLVNVVCVAPKLTKDDEYSYNLTAKIGENTINLKSVVKEWTRPPTENYLMIPNFFKDSVYGLLSL